MLVSPSLAGTGKASQSEARSNIVGVAGGEAGPGANVILDAAGNAITDAANNQITDAST